MFSFDFCIFRCFQSSLTYHDICGLHWWLGSYSSKASEGYKLKAVCLFLICLELLLSLSCNFWHIFGSSDKVTWFLEDLCVEQKRKESGRKRPRQNRIPVIAHTYLLIHFTHTYLLYGCVFLKGGLIGSSFVQEWKSNFYRQLELNNNYLFSFGHKEKVDLSVCLFRSKMRANKCFFNPFAQLVFVVPRQWQENFSLLL